MKSVEEYRWEHKKTLSLSLTCVQLYLIIIYVGILIKEKGKIK